MKSTVEQVLRNNVKFPVKTDFREKTDIGGQFSDPINAVRFIAALRITPRCAWHNRVSSMTRTNRSRGEYSWR